MSATLDVSTPDHHSSAHGADSGLGPWSHDRKAGFAVAMVLFGGLLAGGSAAFLDRFRPDPVRVIPLSLGTTSLGISSALMRAPWSVAPGPQARVDLVLSWPGLGAVDPRLLASLAKGGGPTGRSPWGDTVQVTLTPADDSPASETRVVTLYARFLEAQVTAGPGELLTRRFRPNSPYAGEILVFSPPDGKRLAARCEVDEAAIVPPQSISTSAAGPAEAPLAPQCIAEFRRHGLDIQLRFEPRLAGGLDAVQRRLLALVDSIVR
jgi:hypothetical protein